MRYTMETSHSLDGKLAALHENQLMEFSGFGSVEVSRLTARTRNNDVLPAFCNLSMPYQRNITGENISALAARVCHGEVVDLPYHRNVHLRRPTITTETVSNDILRGPHRRTFPPCTIC